MWFPAFAEYGRPEHAMLVPPASRFPFCIVTGQAPEAEMQAQSDLSLIVDGSTQEVGKTKPASFCSLGMASVWQPLFFVS